MAESRISTKIIFDFGEKPKPTGTRKRWIVRLLQVGANETNHSEIRFGKIEKLDNPKIELEITTKNRDSHSDNRTELHDNKYYNKTKFFKGYKIRVIGWNVARTPRKRRHRHKHQVLTTNSAVNGERRRLRRFSITKNCQCKRRNQSPENIATHTCRYIALLFLLIIYLFISFSLFLLNRSSHLPILSVRVSEIDRNWEQPPKKLLKSFTLILSQHFLIDFVRLEFALSRTYVKRCQWKVLRSVFIHSNKLIFIVMGIIFHLIVCLLHLG